MEKVKFSDEQELAIEAEGKNTLVSAGAGSGKTAVLTERIYRIAKRDNSLDKFLVLTFTNLAASEMKERTRKKLYEDVETRHLASEVDNSHIETFDSFCLYIARKYYFKLGISKDLGIVDNSILTIKRRQILDAIIDKEAEERNTELINLVSAYSINSNDKIKDMVIALLNEAGKKDDPIKFLDAIANDYYDEAHIQMAIDDVYNNKIRIIKLLKNKANELTVVEDRDSIIDFLDSLLQCPDYSSLRDAVNNIAFPRALGDKESRELDKPIRETIKDKYDNKIKIKASGDGDYGSVEDIKQEYRDSQPYIAKLCDLAKKVESQLDAFKREKNIFTFGDISRFVIQLLEDEDIRKEISDSFDYIMVDEYQDTNDIQEYVINAIEKNNVYMVGDVKQSIYRFRGAECQLFQDKYEKYKKNIGGEEIDMNTSYRSRKEVVDFVNVLFSALMKKENNPIDYSNGHEFKAGNTDYPKHPSSCNYRPEVYQYSYEKATEMPFQEANIVASDIIDKINTGYKVFDKDKKELVNCDFKHFAIIIDRSTFFHTFQKVFSSKGIPINIQGKEKLFDSDVVILIRNLIRMLYFSLNGDYEINYKKAFLSVARSFLFNYKDDDLHNIIINDKVLTEPFSHKIEFRKESLRFASIRKTLETLVEDFDIYSHISRITSYYANTHKIEQLLSIASDMDRLGYDLKDFVDYFDDLEKIDLDIDYRDQDTPDNSVTLITIHGSKGLEYPVTYFPGLSKEFNREELKTSFLVSNRYGASIPLVRGNYDSITNALIKKDVIKLDIEEKIRLLYVAITRSREKIILVKGYKKDSNRLSLEEATTLSEILDYTGVLKDCRSEFKLGVSLLSKPKEDKKHDVSINIKSIDIPANVLAKNRASKEVDEEVNQAVLDFGTELHTYLENMNLDCDDLSYIKDFRMRKYVRNVKESFLFKNASNDQIRHEYRFYDEKNNVQGYIDALIIKADEIDIVDFKLKNIDDEEYDKQLRTYKTYVSTLTNLPVRMYLLAAITGEVREVKDE